MKTFYTIILFFFLSINQTYSLEEIVIKFKIENEIITNKDIENEKKYLISLNNDLQKISKSNLNKIAEESIIREKIKRIEILKYSQLDVNNEFVNKIISELYLSLGLQSYEQFVDYINKFGIKIDLVKEKLNIESSWNQLIYQKFTNQLSVDTDKIKKKLKEDISNQKYANTEFELSEIVFIIDSNESFEEKYKKILKSIEDQGFKNTSNLYSISANAKIGGKIGWVSKTQLSKKILNQLEKIKVNDITEPVQVGNGFLIIKIDDKRKKNISINFEKELNKLINLEKNKQYNQFSNIYFNKIKQNVFINAI